MSVINGNAFSMCKMIMLLQSQLIPQQSYDVEMIVAHVIIYSP